MSVKIKISYETEEELNKVLHLLNPVINIKKIGMTRNKTGGYYRAYVDVILNNSGEKG